MWLVVGVLVVLLGLLAALQYQWTGEIGRAEADRQRARLERASQRFAGELGQELGLTMMAFRPEFRRHSSADPRTALLERLARWRGSEHAGLLSRLVLVTISDSGHLAAEAADVEGREFSGVAVPSGLEPFRQQLGDSTQEPTFGRGLRPDTFLASPPAFVVPVIRPGEAERGGFPFRPGEFSLDGVVLVELDEGYLRDVLFPELAEIHFGPLDEGDYAVAVVRQEDGARLYTSDPDLSPEDLARPDVRLGLPASFGPRETREGSLPPERSPRSRWRSGPRSDVAPGVSGGREVGSPLEDLSTGEPGPGDGPPPDWDAGFLGRLGSPWVLVVRHRGGSLAEAVAAVRRRNLAVGLGILALLGVTAALLTVSAQRARSLARQQLEFVAGVTHELHTPLAAIRSAGQNLADGVVSDSEQIQRYGDLIQKEGRRLGALVAQVLDFAGIESGSRVYSAEPLSLGRLVHKVVGDLSLVLEQAGMQVDVDVPEDLPEVRGDAEALGRALENLLTNAAKFARSGGWVGVRAASGAAADTVELRVEDRGPGIPKGERRLVLEPFYRGRDARQSQAPGSGLGLSLVRHVAEVHGGQVRVETDSEGGTAVVMELPAGAQRSEKPR